MQEPARHPTALISWTHRDPEWDDEQASARRDFVVRLAAGLRANGIDADLDQYHSSEQIDWTRWGPTRIANVDSVLVVCSNAWRNAWEGTGDVTQNTGAATEANVLRSLEVTDRDALVTKVRLIVPPGSGDQQIPQGLHGVPRHHFTTGATAIGDGGPFEELVRALTGQAETPMPDLGSLPVLLPRLTAEVSTSRIVAPSSKSPLGSEAEMQAERLRAQLDALPEPRMGTDEREAWFADWQRATQQLQALTSTTAGIAKDTPAGDLPPPGFGVGAVEAGEVAEPPRGRARDIRDQLAAAQLDRLQATVATFEAWGERADRLSIERVLDVGTRIGLLSASGVRTPIWETELHLRFSADPTCGVVITIEDDAGNVRSRHDWSEGIEAIDIFGRLDDAMESLEKHLGPLLFDPIQSIDVAAEALVHAARYRAQRLNMGSQYFDGILEYVEGWYITDAGVVPRGHEHYFIASDRYDEMDWEDHISAKGWDGIVPALRVARAMNDASTSHAPSDARTSGSAIAGVSPMAGFGPSEWVSRQGTNGPEIVLRAAFGAPHPPQLGASTTAAEGVSVLRGEDREDLLVDVFNACELTAKLDALRNDWHWHETQGWEALGGSGGSELTELRVRLQWPEWHLRQGFDAYASVLTGWSSDNPDHAPSKSVIVASDLAISVLELDADRHRSQVAHRSTPLPAPAALSLAELVSYSSILVDTVVSAAAAIYEPLIGSPPPPNGYISLWFKADGVELERLLDLRGLKRLQRPSSATRATVGSVCTINDHRTDLSRGVARDLVERLLEANDYRGVRSVLNDSGIG